MAVDADDDCGVATAAIARCRISRADDVLRGKAITNRLTQEGRDYLDSGMREGMPRFDATALVAAMGAQ